jgi:DNA-binding NarL/FixJ family response regulator
MTSKNPTAQSSRTSILIVDDHPVVREGLAMLLAMQPDLQVCWQTEDVPSALALLEANQPDLAIIDISLKKGNGIDLISKIKDRYPSTRILAWSMYAENLYAERALRAGAQGYLHKGRATSHLLEAIRAVLAGKIYVSEELATELLSRVVGGTKMERSPMELLSNRELEAFELIGHGQTTEKIAESMNVSPKTVETYRARIKEKLGLSNITELVQQATQWVLESK